MSSHIYYWTYFSYKKLAILSIFIKKSPNCRFFHVSQDFFMETVLADNLIYTLILQNRGIKIKSQGVGFIINWKCYFVYITHFFIFKLHKTCVNLYIFSYKLHNEMIYWYVLPQPHFVHVKGKVRAVSRNNYMINIVINQNKCYVN